MARTLIVTLAAQGCVFHFSFLDLRVLVPHVSLRVTSGGSASVSNGFKAPLPSNCCPSTGSAPFIVLGPRPDGQLHPLLLLKDFFKMQQGRIKELNQELAALYKEFAETKWKEPLGDLRAVLDVTSPSALPEGRRRSAELLRLWRDGFFNIGQSMIELQIRAERILQELRGVRLPVESRKVMVETDESFWMDLENEVVHLQPSRTSFLTGNVRALTRVKEELAAESQKFRALEPRLLACWKKIEEQHLRERRDVPSSDPITAWVSPIGDIKGAIARAAWGSTSVGSSDELIKLEYARWSMRT